MNIEFAMEIDFGKKSANCEKFQEVNWKFYFNHIISVPIYSN